MTTEFDKKLEPYYEDDSSIIYLGQSWGTVEKMVGKTIDTIFTDPPYGIGLDYGKKGKDERPQLQYWGILRRLLKKQGTLHMTVGINELPEWFRLMNGALWKYRHTSVYWNERRTDKLADGGATLRGHTHSLGGDWEPWLHYTLPEYEGPLITNKRLPSDIFRHPGAKGSNHPAERDLSAWRAMGELFIKPNTTVLDPFMGTGTTLLVAKELGAKGIGIEREEKWAEYAKNRLAQTTIFEQPVLREG